MTLRKDAGEQGRVQDSGRQSHRLSFGAHTAAVLHALLALSAPLLRSTERGDRCARSAELEIIQLGKYSAPGDLSLCSRCVIGPGEHVSGVLRARKAVPSGRRDGQSGIITMWR